MFILTFDRNSMKMGQIAEIFILDSEKQAIFNARLHYPVQIKKCYSCHGIAISYKEGILFVLHSKHLSYIDHGTVLIVGANMTRATAEEFIYENKILPTKRVKELRLIDLKRYIKAWVADNQNA